MTIEERFESMRKSGAEVRKPLERFGSLDPQSTHAHLDAKNAAFAPGVLPVKYKALMALSAAIALDSSACTANNVMLAKKNGASKEEIMETIAVAKFSKSATVISASRQALEWLSEQGD